jgi:hypothetical protein
MPASQTRKSRRLQGLAPKYGFGTLDNRMKSPKKSQMIKVRMPEAPRAPKNKSVRRRIMFDF